MSDQMQFCPNCGTNLPSGSNVCPQCGIPLNGNKSQFVQTTPAIPTPTIPQGRPNINTMPTAPKPSKSNTGLILGIVGGAIGAIGIGIGLYFFLSKEPSTEPVFDSDFYKPIETTQIDDGQQIIETDFDVAFSKVYHNELLTNSDLVTLTSDELRILRNLPFARHGRRFKSADLQSYFSQFEWYSPLYSDVSLSNLSDNDRTNINLIQNYER